MVRIRSDSGLFFNGPENIFLADPKSDLKMSMIYKIIATKQVLNTVSVGFCPYPVVLSSNGTNSEYGTGIL